MPTLFRAVCGEPRLRSGWRIPVKLRANPLRHRLAAAGIAVVALLGALTGAATPADARKVFRLTIQLPIKSVLGANVLQFKTDVEKASNGELEIQIFDSAQLFDDKDVPKAVSSGQIDMGVAQLARYGTDVPAVDVFHIPFVFSPGILAKAVMPGSAVRQPLDEAILATGARVLWWQAYGSTVLVSKGGPTKAPGDMRGRRVRVTGKLQGIWVVANGGTPVNIGGGQQYFAYQRGAVDIGMTGPDTIRSRRLWEVMDSVTVANMAVSEFLVVINERVFQSLTDNERLLITTAAARAEATLRAEFAQIEADAIEAGRQNKMTVYTPNNAEMDEWRKSAEPVRDDFLKASGPLGRTVYDAATALK
jgi:C4-dicarboxylate-binding protein DctP